MKRFEFVPFCASGAAELRKISIGFAHRGIGLPIAASFGEMTSKADIITDEPAKYVKGRCPFGHGTVHSHPYPGYVHGRSPQICSYGCTPGAIIETPIDRMVREATEFTELFCRERGVSKEKHDGRLTEILEQIRRTGAYDHTFEELEHGSRVAWRNAGKCINRQVHGELQLLDRRGVKTNAEFFECLVDHLRRALAGEAVTAVISIFRASAPSSKSKSGAPVAIGPRIWNNQLVRFAGHELPGGKVLGDPAELQFTKLLKKVFGWAPSGEPSMFDILPLILQIHPNEPPEIFELPKEVARVVDLTHPRIAGFGDLGLKWSVATPPHLDHPVACDPSRLRYKIPARE